MHPQNPFFQAFIYLFAAVVAVPIAKRLGLGSVLGYLAAGALIGPFALGLVGGGSEVLYVAEFGVVMMLFLIGMELRPSRLWKMRRALLGLGGSQVILTMLALGGVALVAGLLGVPAERAQRAAQIFREHDAASMVEMEGLREDQAAYISTARQHIQNLENVLRADLTQSH